MAVRIELSEIRSSLARDESVWEIAQRLGVDFRGLKTAIRWNANWFQSPPRREPTRLVDQVTPGFDWALDEVGPGVQRCPISRWETDRG